MSDEKKSKRVFLVEQCFFYEHKTVTPETLEAGIAEKSVKEIQEEVLHCPWAYGCYVLENREVTNYSANWDSSG